MWRTEVKEYLSDISCLSLRGVGELSCLVPSGV